ncbi:MAG: cyanophycinase [Thermomicrobiales bacterium]
MASTIGSGALLAIGGAEDKFRDRLILRRFVELSGGDAARIAILPTASGLRDAGLRYQSIFEEFGAKSSDVLQIRSREQAFSDEYVRIIRESSGIFMTGGNQVRIAAILGGSDVGKALLEANQGGAIVAGTSAGASVMTGVMVAGGDYGRTPRANLARMAPGLGLIENAIIDQHFRQRDRVARLMTMVSYNPGLLGLGIDEDTAALIDADGCIEVLGAGTVLFVDGRQMVSNVHSRRGGTPLNITNAVVHFLTSGSRFDLNTRTAYPNTR